MHSLRCGTNSGVESFLTHAGYGALILFAFVQACSIPISSEITFGFAGVLASQGHLSLPLVIVLGTLAELAGSFASYAVGRRGGRPAVERLGRFVLITGSDIDRAERFFDGRGAWAVAVGRVIPLVRAFIGLAAGMIEIPALPFGLFNLLGTADLGHRAVGDRLRHRQFLDRRGARVLAGRVRARGRVRAQRRRHGGVPAARGAQGGGEQGPGRARRLSPSPSAAGAGTRLPGRRRD